MGNNNSFDKSAFLEMLEKQDVIVVSGGGRKSKIVLEMEKRPDAPLVDSVLQGFYSTATTWRKCQK